ncbi:hypothetical protein H310_06923 [Aphanomyces invadans]|uniref:Importin-7/11-like TPR repeats domain-containing protein n=1 Tax=Aphanomyces invadans TaxID=157072 RepID=A0A024U709_9STRA|nr:hypothetical protein H310_06923 [Aphanomyces invadans]ETW01373.1 hypothetical protein H310_06923 [Aphanomyces invadans]|eukprot:XP_008870371.1 hypothetical protein H310_06923 [Aphanomyces invadans]
MTSEDSVRACAEMLYLSLLQTHRDALTPCILRMMQSTSAWMASPTPVQDDILRADAVLLAAGLSSYDLHESFDFEPWFLHTLVPYLQSPISQTVSGVPVLPRRIVWLIGCWLAQLSNQVRIPLYEALLQLLSAPKSDTCVKLAAVQTLESLVNDWGFDQATFVPFLPSAIGCLYTFFGDPAVVTTDTRLKVLGCVEAIVHVCGSAMGPCIIQVVNPLPAIWEAAGSVDANLLRGKILSLLTRIMEIDWQDVADVELQNMVLSVVSFATNPNQPDSVYLMDQGLALWIRLTEVVDAYTPPLHDVFANIVQTLSRDTEHVQSGLMLLENYAILGTTTFWSAYGLDVSRLVRSFVGEVKPEISHVICRVVDRLLQLLPPDSVMPLQDVLAALWAIVQEQPRQEKELVVVSYLSTLAAASLHAPAVFFTVVPTDHVSLFLDTMLQFFFSVAFTAVGPVRRRIWVSSLCSFLTVTPAVLERMGLILEACVEVVGEADPLDVNDDDLATTRRSLLLTQKTKLLPPTIPYIKQYVCAQLNQCAQMVGAEAFSQSMALVEASVVNTIQAL